MTGLHRRSATRLRSRTDRPPRLHPPWPPRAGPVVGIRSVIPSPGQSRLGRTLLQAGPGAPWEEAGRSERLTRNRGPAGSPPRFRSRLRRRRCARRAGRPPTKGGPATAHPASSRAVVTFASPFSPSVPGFLLGTSVEYWDGPGEMLRLAVIAPRPFPPPCPDMPAAMRPPPGPDWALAVGDPSAAAGRSPIGHPSAKSVIRPAEVSKPSGNWPTSGPRAEGRRGPDDTCVGDAIGDVCGPFDLVRRTEAVRRATTLSKLSTARYGPFRTRPNRGDYFWPIAMSIAHKEKSLIFHNSTSA